MPWPRIKIAEFLIGYPVELGKQFNDLTGSVAMIRSHVVAWPVTNRTPQNCAGIAREDLARLDEVRGVAKFERQMVHTDRIALQKIDGVMVGIAAHKDKEILDPIGDTESEDVAIKARHFLRVVDHEGQVSQL